MSTSSVLGNRTRSSQRRRQILWLMSLVLLCTGCTSSISQEAQFYTSDQDRDGLVQSASRQGLPNVLIIGDSISIGYTPVVRELLKDRANVQRPQANCGDTRRGLKDLKQWLGDTKWDVIHFNWGLHDLCYRNYQSPEAKIQGYRDKVNGKIAVPIESYEQNLETLVQQLKATGATLVWASTTVVPEGEAGRFVGDDKKYNDAAARVMRRHNIIVDDLYSLTKGFPPALFTAPGNVHYTKEGSRLIAQQVAATIDKALKLPDKNRPRTSLPAGVFFVAPSGYSPTTLMQAGNKRETHIAA